MNDCIPGLQEVRVHRAEFHPVCDDLKHQTISDSKPVLGDEQGTGFPESDAPNFTLVMNFVSFEGAKSIDGTDGNARVWNGLRRINVFKRKGVLVGVRAIRIMPNSIVVVLSQAAELIAGVSTGSINSIRVISGLTKEAETVKIGPSFTHPFGLQSTDEGPPANQTRAQPMSIFVQHNLCIEITVAVGSRPGKGVHLHAARKAIGRRAEIGIIRATAILSVRLHTIVTHTTTIEIGILEVTGRLREAQVIELVVHEVVPVEELDNGSIPISVRTLSQIEGRIKDAVWIAHWPWKIRLIIRVTVQMSVHVVAAGFVVGIVDPAIGRSIRADGVGHYQRALHQRRLCIARSGQARRHRRGAIACKNAIAGVADIACQSVTHENLAGFGINQDAEHFTTTAAR